MPDGSDAAPGPADPMFGYLERFASVLVAAGIPPMPARVFVALLVAGSAGSAPPSWPGGCRSARPRCPAGCAT